MLRIHARGGNGKRGFAIPRRGPSSLLRGRQFHAERAKGLFDALAAFPELAPQVALRSQALEDRLPVESLRSQRSVELRPLDGSGDRSLGKGPHDISGGERSAIGVLGN